jgi:hypothetical protein
MIYTASLTGNRRETSTLTPKALIINIDPTTELNRDHCWVGLTEEIERLQPAGHKPPIRITFEADLKPYLKQGTMESMTLTNLTNIKKV